MNEVKNLGYIHVDAPEILRRFAPLDDKKRKGEKTLWNSVYSVVRLNHFFTPMRSFEASHLRTGSS